MRQLTDRREYIRPSRMPLLVDIASAIPLSILSRDAGSRRLLPIEALCSYRLIDEDISYAR
jgi:hypothetical protein